MRDPLESRCVRQAIAAQYAAHYRSCSGATNRLCISPEARNKVCRMYDWDILPFLPAWRDLPVVELGTGYGHFLEYLLDRGFSNVTAVDSCEELLAAVKERLGSRLSGAHTCDATTFLSAFADHFGLIVLFDIIEHMGLDEGFHLLCAAHRALAPCGLIMLRTPNMANLMGSYVRYNDLTHSHGYTALTLKELLELAGFTRVLVCDRTRRRTWAGQGAQILSNLLHRFLVLISRTTPSQTYQLHLFLRAQRTPAARAHETALERH